jgi:hypothetical protein
LEPIIAALMAKDLLAKDSEGRLIPARDPHHVTLTEIVATIRGGGTGDMQTRNARYASIDAIADRIDAAIVTELGQRTLGQLVDEDLDED